MAQRSENEAYRLSTNAKSVGSSRIRADWRNEVGMLKTLNSRF
jgi:hypothetical protein